MQVGIAHMQVSAYFHVKSKRAGRMGQHQMSSKTRHVCVMQGIKATSSKPNSYLFQALALMATELKYTEEARQWYMQGTRTVMVSHNPPHSCHLKCCLMNQSWLCC